MKQPLLDKDLELDLARRWREQGDEAALHHLVESYTRLVVSTATRFRSYGLPLGDLIQEGNVGLMQAASRFEPEREVRFSTYATWWIRSAMQDYVLRNWSIVRTGTTASQKTLFFNLRRLRAKIQTPLTGRLTEENRKAIAKELAVGIHEVEAMEVRLASGDASLNMPIGEDGDQDWQDFLADEAPSPEEVVIGSRDSESRSRWLAQAIGKLSDREQEIIRQRRLSTEGATLEQLGQHFGVSKERIRQLETRALSKLRALIECQVECRDELFVES